MVHMNTSDLLKNFGGIYSNDLNNLINQPDSTDEYDTSTISQYVTLQNLPKYIPHAADQISVISLNCQSINAKFDQLHAIIHDLEVNHNFKFSVILLQETWLSGKDPDISLYSLPGYQSFALGASCSTKGGLLCYVIESIKTKVKLKVDNSKFFECIFIELEGSKSSFVTVGNIYRPPRLNNNDSSIANFIREFSPVMNNIVRSCENTIIAGDFNINLLKVLERDKYAEFLDLMMSAGFLPKITYPTRYAKKSASLIDQIFVRTKISNTINQSSLSGILYSGISDHFAPFTRFCFKSPSVCPKYVIIHKKDENSMNAFKNAIQSQNLLNKINQSITGDPNHTFEVIQSEINKAKALHLPSKRVRFNKYKHKNKNWITSGIIKSINFRDKLYTKFKSCKTSDPSLSMHKSRYNNFNKILKKTIKEAKSNFYGNEFSKHSDNIKKSWQTINQILNRDRKSNQFPTHIKIDNTNISDRKQIADHFNNYFACVGENLAEDIPTSKHSFDKYLHNRILTSFSFKTVDHETIAKIIKDFKPKTSSGDDGISMKLLKLISNSITPSLTILINQSLTTGIFPCKMKIAKVLPFIKKPNVFELGNFRPISLLSSLSKILEKCVFDQVCAYFEDNKLFYSSQYGYRKNHSTDYACVELVDKVMHDLDKGETPICFFLDLSKAFDTLNHDILLSKLRYYGLDDNVIKWFKSYLTGRSQYVEIENTRSSTKPINTGVPQGSILGPLLFIIYVNDINCASSKFEAILYADDTSLNSILRTFSNENTSLSINKELLLVYEWLKSNKLSLNISKTKFMCFRYPQRRTNNYPLLDLYIEGNRIERVTTFDFLGVTINETLTWKDHLHKLCMKISRVVGIIAKCRKFLHSSVLLKIYNALILSRINYGILCWGFENKRIYILQKKALRLICKTYYLAHTDPLFIKLNTMKVKDIYVRHCLKFFYNHEKGWLPSYFSNFVFRNISNHDHATRFRNEPRGHHTNRISSEKILKHLLPKLLIEIPRSIKDSVYTHSLQAVKIKFKLHVLGTYRRDCTLRNCYVCNAM